MFENGRALTIRKEETNNDTHKSRSRTLKRDTESLPAAGVILTASFWRGGRRRQDFKNTSRSLLAQKINAWILFDFWISLFTFKFLSYLIFISVFHLTSQLFVL